jgi:uncharacterized membrane protein
MTIDYLISKQKQRNLLLLALFSFMLVAFRIIATQRVFYGFLIFNLILAIIPFLIAFVWLITPRLHNNKFLLLLGTAGWLLFLPNAPYLVTDFLHFKKESAMPEWFDVLMLTSFSCSGLAFGFTSLAAMQQLWESRFGKRMAEICIFTGCLLSGLGVYIGRFLRYNSWDILHKPFALVADLPPLLFELKAVGFSIGYGVFFFLFYRIFKNNQ